MKIIFSGGGTLGPVVPLLAVAEICRRHYPEIEFVWVGTKRGPERELVEKYGMPFFAVSTAKWRRYFSVLNIFDFFRFILAFLHAFLLLWQEKPAALISAGGYVSVPVHWAGTLLGIPQWIHQQDAVPGMANKLMAPGAKKITVALRESLAFFNPKKSEWLGNPVRDLRFDDISAARAHFGIPALAPVIFVIGGGTGSARLNQMLLEALPAWPKDWRVIHLVGQRPREMADRAAAVFANYHAYEFFTEEMKFAYAAADVVVARGGFGTITELAALKKAAILMPMAGTHQEKNVKFLEKNNAVLTLDERTDNGLKLAQMVKTVMESAEERSRLGERLNAVLPPAAEEKIIKIIDELIA